MFRSAVKEDNFGNSVVVVEWTCDRPCACDKLADGESASSARIVRTCASRIESAITLSDVFLLW